MERQGLIKIGRFNLFISLLILLLISSCVYIRISDDIDLGEGYYYVQDYPQCICKGPKPGLIVIPVGDKEEIVVRVQYNDSVIIATCSSYYYTLDSTVYKIEKRTGKVIPVASEAIDSEIDTYKEIKNHYRYKQR